MGELTFAQRLKNILCDIKTVQEKEVVGPNPLYHRDDLVDLPRAMEACIQFSRQPYIYLSRRHPSFVSLSTWARLEGLVQDPDPAFGLGLALPRPRHLLLLHRFHPS